MRKKYPSDKRLEQFEKIHFQFVSNWKHFGKKLDQEPVLYRTGIFMLYMS
jgi:hypothetical protein